MQLVPLEKGFQTLFVSALGVVWGKKERESPFASVSSVKTVRKQHKLCFAPSVKAY